MRSSLGKKHTLVANGPDRTNSNRLCGVLNRLPEGSTAGSAGSTRSFDEVPLECVFGLILRGQEAPVYAANL